MLIPSTVAVLLSIKNPLVGLILNKFACLARQRRICCMPLGLPYFTPSKNSFGALIPR
jgi:hypothetical protein